MIAMLGHLQGVSDVSIEATESDSCREVLEDNRNTNSMLATIWEKARFFCKDGWIFTNPFT